MTWVIMQGDCLDQMPALAAGSADSIVTDPPYGLKFMGKHWDKGVPGPAFWVEALRVAKPGAYLLACGGTRTYHRLAAAIEDAGWEIRDCIFWVYGEGFPKSLDISKAIDQLAGAERQQGRLRTDGRGKWALKCQREPGSGDSGIGHADGSHQKYYETLPETEAAKQRVGWGTALKPAVEPIILARRPISEKSIVRNILEHGTGALNIDKCRVETVDKLVPGGALRTNAGDDRKGKALGMFQDGTKNTFEQHEKGRWPANLILSDEKEVTDCFPKSGGGNTPARRGPGGISCNGHSGQVGIRQVKYGAGSAARFFKSIPLIEDETAELTRLIYMAKASKAIGWGG